MSASPITSSPGALTAVSPAHWPSSRRLARVSLAASVTSHNRIVFLSPVLYACMGGTPSWLATIANKSSSSLSRCDGAPGSVAFIIAGAARTFATPLQLHSVRHYFVRPLTQRLARADLFLYLKTADSDKNGLAEGSRVSFSARTVDLRPLLAALNSSWLRGAVREAIIVNGSGSFEGRGWRAREVGGDASAAVKPSNATGWRRYRQQATGWEACHPPFGSRGLEGNASARRAASGDGLSTLMHGSAGANDSGAVSIGAPAPLSPAPPCMPPPSNTHSSRSERGRVHAARPMQPTTELVASNNQEQRMLEAALALRWCGDAIERSERASGRTYRVVAFMRPDLLLPSPLPAWCAYPYEHKAFACATLGGDSLWVVPREHMRRLTLQADAHRRCRRSLDLPANFGRQWERTVHRNQAACCGPPEALLWHALHAPRDAGGEEGSQSSPSSRNGKPHHPKVNGASSDEACGVLRRLNQHYIRRASGGGRFPETLENGRPITTPKVVERKHRANWVLSQRHVCSVALSTVYDALSYALQQGEAIGLTRPVGLYLRSIFGWNSTGESTSQRAAVDECIRALAPFSQGSSLLHSLI